MSGYRILDHTADLAIEARGRDFPELVLQAARGLLALLLDRPDIAPTDSVAIKAEGPTRERALVGALREVLDLIEDEGRVPVSAALGSGDMAAPELAIGTVPLETVSTMGRKATTFSPTTGSSWATYACWSCTETYARWPLKMVTRGAMRVRVD